ncbi:dihydroneopterin aldolase [Orrella sp. 11846]|uniref:dihydroneopterin aldolase n=1 Tax=Orrella sp. 11846 TaxID=3409913 RepID=UPI003B58BD65
MSTRKIIFSGIALQASIGILDHEKLAKQPILVDTQLDVDVHQAADEENIETVLDYRLVHETIVHECTDRHTNLLETLTDRLAHTLLNRFPDVRSATVRVTKLTAFADTGGVAIEVTAQRPTA